MRPWATRFDDDPPMGEVGERNDALASNPQHLAQHQPRLGQGLQSLFQHHHVEAAVGKPAQPLAQIGLQDRHATLGGGQHCLGIDLHALTAHLAFALQPLQQLSVAAAQVQHAGTRLNLAGDDVILPAEIG